MLEAVVARWLLSGVPGFTAALKKTYDAAAFIVIAVALAPVVGALVGVTALTATGLEPWGRYPELWREWWIGDALGALLVGPAILTVVLREPTSRPRRVETILLVSGALVGAAVLSGPYLTFATGFGLLALVIFPLVIVAAVRLGQPATTIVTLCAATVIVWNTMSGYRPFGAEAVRENLLLLDVFLAVLAGCGLLLAAATTERHNVERQRAAMYGAANVIATAPSLEVGAPELLGAIGRHLGWQAGSLWLVDTSGTSLRCAATWAAEPDKTKPFNDASTAATFARGIGLPGRVWESEAPTWIEDVTVDANFPRAAIAQAAGLHGAFGFPIRRREMLIGVVEFFTETVAATDLDLLSTMASIGNQIGDFVTRKQIERAMVEQQTRTHAILESALDAIISIDQEGVITEFNSAAEKMFGHPRAQAIGTELAELIIPPRLREQHRRGIGHFLETGSGPFIDRRIETTALATDGREFPVEVSITSVPTHPPMFTGFVRDTTERVNAERQRRGLLEAEAAARREAESANRAKDDFLATVSHELRTPLNAIVGWTRMLLEGILDEQSARRALTIIDRNAHAQAQLVTDLLDISRIITGKLSLAVRPVDMGSVIGAALDTVRPAADAKRIVISTSLGAPVRLVNGDFHRLQQMVWNLLSNAIKFTPEGGTVEVRLAEHDSKIRLRISDSGAGISPDFLPFVFDRFRQADGSSTRQHGGLGLGLAIVRHIVELHGGTAAADSAGPGKGAAFTIDLPQMPASSPSPRDPTTVSDRNRMSDRQPLSGRRVMVVEDDEDTRHLLNALLVRAGATVDQAGSVEDAMRQLRAQPVDAVLADVGLPGRDGYALVRELRALQTGAARTPVVAVTAYARPEDRDEALARGFDAYLAKPVDPRGMIELLTALTASATQEPLES
jgi:PAS domain S-box-containing protein